MLIQPPISIFWFRWRMAMSTAERLSSARNAILPYHLAIKRYWRPLLGSAAAWFIYNYIAYPFGLFSSSISASVNAGDSLVKSYGWGTLINCFYLPGGFIGGYLSDKIGRRKTTKRTKKPSSTTSMGGLNHKATAYDFRLRHINSRHPSPALHI